MTQNDNWRTIVASALDWEQAHTKLDAALVGIAPHFRGTRPTGLPHSIWELLEHIRLAQHDLLEFCVSENYHEPKWPDDYWPSARAPASDAEWSACIDAIHRDTAAFAALTTDESRDLTAKIPHGTGQTYLRTVLVAVAHSSYHVGQIVDVRRLIGAWPPPK